MDDKQFLLTLGLAINNKKVTKFINILLGLSKQSLI